MENIVEVQHLYYQYPNGTKALKDINLNIQKGEFVAIMGPNGAGKSTLCLTLNGVIPHSIGGQFSGVVQVKGLDTFNHKIPELAQIVGLVQQNPEAQLFMANLEQELAFGPENLGHDPAAIRQRIQDTLHLVRLDGLEKRPPSALSGGQKQRAAIASVLTMLPEIIVLDEPTSQLDPMGTEEVFILIKELNRHGKTIILAEHKSEMVVEFADRVIVLNHGSIVLDGPPHDVFSKVDHLRNIMLKPPQVTLLTDYLKRNGLSAEEPAVTFQDSVKYLESVLRSDQISSHLAEKITPPTTSATRKVILEARALRYSYPTGVEALKDANIQVHQGEFVAIIGQNGAGKTTLVKHFLNLLQPSSGKAIYSGYNCSEYPVFDLARHIGMLLQNPDHHLFETTVYKEIAFGVRNLLKLSKPMLDARVREALAALDLLPLMDRHPLSLSWGDRQKVAVATILSLKPRVIIFDEPTTGMDYIGRHNIMQIALQLNKQGHTILVISHDMELIAEYCSHVIIMGKGRILFSGSTRDALSNSSVLAETFLKPPQITALAQKLTQYGVPPNLVTINDFCDLLGLPRPEEAFESPLMSTNGRMIP